MQIDTQRIDRLIALSKEHSYNYRERFDWPKDVHLDCLWCNEDLLTTYGTDIHDRLSITEKIALSKWEAVNFFSLNVHGIKGVLEFVCQCIYEQRYNDISDYLHIFIAEENAHMWFFASFCKRYARKIYPSTAFATGATEDLLERDLYMFASTLIFEEFVDFYNHKVGTNTGVADIVREINHQHHLDESRHVSFGREVVKELYTEIVNDDISDAKRERISLTIKSMIRYFISLMYNPQTYVDAGIVEAAGFTSGSALRNSLRNNPSRGTYHGVWFRRTADFFKRTGLIDDVTFVAQ